MIQRKQLQARARRTASAEKPAARPGVFVELHDVTAVARPLGYLCPTRLSERARELAGAPRKVRSLLEHFLAIVRDSGDEPAFGPLRAAVWRGETPDVPRPRALAEVLARERAHLDASLEYIDGLERGVRGVSADGRRVSFEWTPRRRAAVVMLATLPVGFGADGLLFKVADELVACGPAFRRALAAVRSPDAALERVVGVIQHRAGRSSTS